MTYVLRSTIGLICIIFVVDSLLLVLNGVLLTYEAYHNFITGAALDRPLLPALEAVDMFFMALSFFIVAIGLAQLFVGDLAFVKGMSLSWLRIESFAQLKMLLWDTFLVTLFVFFVTRVVSAPTHDWNLLILPAAIALLTVSSFLLKLKH